MTDSYPSAVEAEANKRASWPPYLMGALFALGLIATVAWNIELPYQAWGPGPVSDAADSVMRILKP